MTRAATIARATELVPLVAVLALDHDSRPTPIESDRSVGARADDVDPRVDGSLRYKVV